MIHRVSVLRYELNARLGQLHPALLSMALIIIAAHIGTAVISPLLGWGHGIEAISLQAIPADAFEGRLARWDSGYYLRIAELGYRPDGPERAFFPLYPLLCRALSSSLGISILWSGWLVTLPCFLGATLFLYRLVHEDYSAHTAKQSLLAFCFFPVAFYNLAFYPEALYLLSSIASIYYARRGRFLVSGFCIAIAGATRPVAFLLAIPFVIEFIVQRQYSPLRWLNFAGGMVLAPLGTLSYIGFLSWLASGANPIAIYTFNLQQYWYTKTTWPWETLFQGAQSALLGVGIGADWFSRAVVWQDLLFAIGGLALASWGLCYLRLSYGAYFVAGMLFFASSHGPGGYVFEGMPRHVASLVPVYIVLGLALERVPQRLHWVVLVSSAALLAFLTAWFASGRWVS